MENSENEVNYAFVNFHLSPSSQSSFGSLVFLHLWINFCSFFTPVIKFLSWKPKLYFAFHSIGRVVVNILADERWARHVCITNSTKKKIIHWFFWVISLVAFHIFTHSWSTSCTPLPGGLWIQRSSPLNAFWCLNLRLCCRWDLDTQEVCHVCF